MSDEPTVNGIIVDTLSRLESKVDAGFADTAAKLDGKADKGDLREIKGELRGLDSRVKVLEEDQRHGTRTKDEKQHFRNAVYAVLVLAAYWFGPVIDKAIWH